jgi:hypothetical protein
MRTESAVLTREKEGCFMKNRLLKTLLAIALVIIIGLVVPVACAKSSGVAPIVPAPARPPSEGQASGGSEGVAGVTDGNLPAVSADRMVVRNGNMSLTVKDVAKSRDDIAQLAVGLGGYVVSTSFSGKDKEFRGSIVIRVPDDKFEQALTQLRKLAVKVQSESTSSQDVTEEYTDLTSRLKNAQATESQYLALLAKATTVEDILKIQDKLSQTRNTIEQIKGRMQYLEKQTSMSLITIYLEPDGSESPIVNLDWNILDELKSALSGFVSFLLLLTTVLIWLLIFSPLWGGIIAIVYFIRRWRRRRQKAS